VTGVDVSDADFARLRAVLAGEVLESGTPGYEAARRPAMPRFWDIRPRAVVRAASAEDVAHTLAFAATSGLPVVPRGGGHCFAGRSSTDGIVLDLTPLRQVRVAADGAAVIGAGARLAEVYDGLDEHGLTLPAGCGPDVGIAGLTLGGGLGILGRSYGLTCDRLRAAQVVLTDGRVVSCDEHREPELFWALRGAGGGQFGVVTSLVFAPVRAPEATRFELIWPAAAAPAVTAAWQRWAPDAPDELNASLKITAEPHGQPGEVIVFGAMLAGRPATAALLADLIAEAGAPPGPHNLATMPFRDLKRSLDTLGSAAPAPPQPEISKSEFFRRPLPPSAIAELLDTFTAGRPPGQRRALNFTPMGGAYNRVPEDATAFAHRHESFLLEHVAPVSDAGWARRSWAIAHPYGSGRVYPNFPDPDLPDPADAYHGPNHARLVRVKHRYDPLGLLHFPQSL
jgi:FAD/FMN-containing dehydrogenase